MRHRVVVLLAAPATVLAGCGGVGDDGAASSGRRPADTRGVQYAAALNRAQDGLTTRFGRLQRGVGATSTPEQDRRTLVASERAVATTVAELRRVTPPPGVASLHARLIAQVAGYRTAIRTVRRRIAAGGPRAALAAQGQLAAAIARVERRLDATIRAINGKLGG